MEIETSVSNESIFTLADSINNFDCSLSGVQHICCARMIAQQLLLLD